MTEVLEPALPTIAMGNFADAEVADVDESLKSAVTRSRHFDVRMRSNHCMLRTLRQRATRRRTSEELAIASQMQISLFALAQLQTA